MQTRCETMDLSNVIRLLGHAKGPTWLWTLFWPPLGIALLVATVLDPQVVGSVFQVFAGVFKLHVSVFELLGSVFELCQCVRVTCKCVPVTSQCVRTTWECVPITS